MVREQLSEESIASPNYRLPKGSEFVVRKHFSFNSPHRMAVANKKIKINFKNRCTLQTTSSHLAQPTTLRSDLILNPRY